VSRYLLLVLVNVPFVLAGLLGTIVSYKMKQSSKRRTIFKIVFWLSIFAALALAYPIYEFLFDKELTDTEPMSLFDVIQISGIIGLTYVATRLHGKVENLERRVQDLHQELSIRLSERSR
jgi:hypothetical protein